VKRTFQRLGLGLILTTLLLATAEGGLRLLGPELQAIRSPLVYQQASGQAWTPGKSPGSKVYVSGRRRVVASKPAGLRVLVFGASAAFGELFTESTAFPAQAQRLLRAANPDQTLEILNLAHGGMGSRQVGEMVAKVLASERPDLIVVYSGNNEYHELRALKAASDRYDPQAELLRRRMSQSYLYRQLRDWVAPSQDTLAPPEGVEWLPIGRMDVLVDEDDRQLGRLLYREHLLSIVEMAEQAGVPLLLTTVSTNLQNHVDTSTPGVISAESERRLHDLGAQVDPSSADDFLAAAQALSPQLQTEGAQHRLGQLLLRAGLQTEALAAFEQAEALALRPMSADKHLRQSLLQIGQSTETPVCDLAGAMAEGAQSAVPGSAEFVDHCHPTAAGHERLGTALARCIAEQGLLPGYTHTAVAAAELTLSSTAADPYRLDHHRGHRDFPGQPPTKLAPAGTALGATQRGHQAFLDSKYSAARRAYTRAGKLGAPAGATAVNQALTALYLLDLQAARQAAAAAKLALPYDIDVQQLSASLR
jgi:lysophospholipase L1-like esterase